MTQIRFLNLSFKSYTDSLLCFYVLQSNIILILITRVNRNYFPDYIMFNKIWWVCFGGTFPFFDRWLLIILWENGGWRRKKHVTEKLRLSFCLLHAGNLQNLYLIGIPVFPLKKKKLMKKKQYSKNGTKVRTNESKTN